MARATPKAKSRGATRATSATASKKNSAVTARAKKAASTSNTRASAATARRTKVSGAKSPAVALKPTAAKAPAKRAVAKATSAKRAPAKIRPKAAIEQAAIEEAASEPAKARPPATGAGAIVRMVESERPSEELLAFLDSIQGQLSTQQGQIALGAAQLMLVPYAREQRGSYDALEILDPILGRWQDLPDTSGFHAQELLRNAFAAVGGDRERIRKLATLVPNNATPELRFNVACALACAGDRTAMLRAVEAALAAGATPAQFRGDSDFEVYQDDPSFVALLERAGAPRIPVDVTPHVTIVRAALDAVVKMLREFGENVMLEPPASIDAISAAERAARVQLPNDYRALLTLTDGMTLTDNRFLGTRDFRVDTSLARDARQYLAMSSGYGLTGIDDCVPLANWGGPNDWLLYDPHGRIRNGSPGYVLMLNADDVPLDGLAHALERFDRIMREVLGTN